MRKITDVKLAHMKSYSKVQLETEILWNWGEILAHILVGNVLPYEHKQEFKLLADTAFKSECSYLETVWPSRPPRRLLTRRNQRYHPDSQQRNPWRGRKCKRKCGRWKSPEAATLSSWKRRIQSTPRHNLPSPWECLVSGWGLEQEVGFSVAGHVMVWCSLDHFDAPQQADDLEDA